MPNNHNIYSSDRMLIYDICSRMHLNNPILQKTMDIFCKLQHHSTKYSKQVIAAYCIKKALEIENVARSLIEISYCSDVEIKTVHTFEKMLMKQKEFSETKSVDAASPLCAKDFISTYYLYLDLDYKDYESMIEHHKKILPNDFSPATEAACIMYLHCKNSKNMKITMKKVAKLFNISSVNICRFINYLKRTSEK